MRAILDFLVLPSEISDFERSYLKRVNRIAMVFFAMHLPVFALVAYFNDTNPWLALVLTSAVLCGPLLAQRALKSPRSVSVVYGITAMFMGGLLVHFGQGPVQIEMHFYFFALVAMCAVFGNPMVIVAATVTVALHHLALWLLVPRSVFNYSAAWWVVGVHATFVVLESVATCFIARSFFDNVIGLEKIVGIRTKELDSRNQEMRMLLDSVQQGFLTIDRSGRMAQERSAIVETWFGVAAPSATWFDYLAASSPVFADKTRLSWDQVIEDFMPAEVALAQMPASLTHGAVHYRFEYHPIGVAEQAQQYLVIVTNVTTEVERERAETERREMMALFERVLADRPGVQTFFEEGTSMLDALVAGASTDLKLVKRLVHTMKGNAACYGLSSVSALCHDLEDAIAESNAVPARQAYMPLEQRWKQLAADLDKLLGIGQRTIQIDDAQYAALEAAVRAGVSGRSLLDHVLSLKLEPTSKRLQHFADQAKRIAERLDKHDLRIDVEHHGLRLDHSRWAPFWSAFVHAVRNAVDHGIEVADERVSEGKTAEGSIVLRTFEEKGRLVVEIKDDGRGIDWDGIAKRAVGAGLPAGTQQDLEHALFADGISTAATVTDVSGRGVGMGALLSATDDLGGHLSVRSALSTGTTVRFSFPPSAERAPESIRPQPELELTGQ